MQTRFLLIEAPRNESLSEAAAEVIKYKFIILFQDYPHTPTKWSLCQALHWTHHLIRYLKSRTSNSQVLDDVISIQSTYPNWMKKDSQYKKCCKYLSIICTDQLQPHLHQKSKFRMTVACTVLVGHKDRQFGRQRASKSLTLYPVQPYKLVKTAERVSFLPSSRF